MVLPMSPDSLGAVQCHLVGINEPVPHSQGSGGLPSHHHPTSSKMLASVSGKNYKHESLSNTLTGSAIVLSDWIWCGWFMMSDLTVFDYLSILNQWEWLTSGMAQFEACKAPYQWHLQLNGWGHVSFKISSWKNKKLWKSPTTDWT